ncbi:putative beta-glucosidase domain protein [Mycobacterium kansasii]|uniref:Putative beta-glucosidase domain protein n=1 Tax=Mycobacterium kansasii TaxID=1768 RepID=A0A1V3WCQ0_MYCKA|nr:putative beta-glucosidase domain protein [Mycobacterium kansasii]
MCGGRTRPDARAREIESQMTDDERFALLVGVMGAGTGGRCAMSASRPTFR